MVELTYGWKAMCVDAVLAHITFIRTFIRLSWLGRLFTVLMWTPTMMVFPMTRPMTTTFFLPRQSTFLTSLSWLGRLFLVMTYTTMAIPMTTVWTPMTFSTFLKSLSWLGRLFTVLMWTPTMMVFPMTRPMTTTFLTSLRPCFS